MAHSVTIFQTVVAVILIVLILLQQRGTGVGGAFGGEGATYSTRRGAEQVIFTATIVLAILFVGASIVRLLV